MGYREEQRQKAVQIRDVLFRDPDSGVFYGKERDFMLKDRSILESLGRSPLGC